MSRINLNLSPGTSYHMKVPEVIATSNFMLTRRIDRQWDTMPITDFFEENNEIILFDDELDLIKKASFFLKNKTERESIAKAAYHKFINHYSLNKSTRAILDKLISANIPFPIK
jgi:spore maturation protein CgeB